MAENEFSETNYTFAFVHEFITKHSPTTVVPYFPSAREENNFPVDAMVGSLTGSLFLFQFKLTKPLKHFLTIKGLETQCSQIRKLLGSPYCKMDVYYSNKAKKCEQQEKLFNLAETLQKAGDPAKVYYVAPRFWTRRDLNNHFVHGSIVEKSAFINPLGLAGIDLLERHRVVFNPNSRFGWVCSEPHNITIGTSSSIMQDLEQSKEDKPSIEELSYRLKKALWAADINLSEGIMSAETPHEILKGIGQQLFLDYGLCLFGKYDITEC